VRLDEWPIDELYQLALGEHLDDRDMTAALHKLYAAVSLVLRRIIRLAAEKRKDR
jgi:hypothetical protein